MLEKLSESSGNVIGFKAVGDITKADYDILTPEVESLAQQHDSICLLMDLTEFKWEKAEAWRADMKFGSQFRKNIAKMAIVGDKKWEKWLTKVCAPFYAREAKHFSSDDIGSAWDWLRA